MKTLQKFKTITAALLLSVITFSCNDDDTTGPSESLLQIAEQNASLSTFVQAVERAEITDFMEGSQARTVLAPSNTAFNEFFIQNGYSSIDAVPVDVLKQLLYNHVITGTINSEEFISGYTMTNATGAASTNRISLFIDTISGVRFNGHSTLITPNLEARNGVLHIVDRVIKIPTVYDHIAANPALSAFRSALAQDPGAGFINTLSNAADSPFTVFAPQNPAFTAYLTETDYETVTDIPDDMLTSLLNYHIVTSENFLNSDFFHQQTVDTRNGQDFVITLTGGGKKITDVNGRISNIIFTDIQGSNGVLHVLDTVLMPN